MRNTYVLIHLKDLENNVKEIIKTYPYEYYFGVVKANAYGHGFEVIPTLEKGGINYFCTSSLEEAICVRRYTKKPILCFGYVSTKNIKEVIDNDITLSIISYEYFQELLHVNQSIKIHIKINSGMNRFGIKDKKQLKEIVNKLSTSNMILEGIYTHLATSGVNDQYYDKQIESFKEITKSIDIKKIPIIHIFNSLALARHKKLDFTNGVRLGLMMYGFTYNINISSLTKLQRKIVNKHISPTTLNTNINLKKVLSLHSEVVNINVIKRGEFVGYGAKFIAKENGFVAIIPIGHADGITNVYKQVIIQNKVYNIIGICMDYIMVLVDENIKVHDKVSLIDETLTISKICSSISPHQLLVNISNRVPRKYEE